MMKKNWVFLDEKRVESRNFASSRVESAKKVLDSTRVESSQDSYPSLYKSKEKNLSDNKTKLMWS